MNAVESPYASRGGRHRGERHDPVGTALTLLWGLGHVVTILLVVIAADHQLSTEHPGAAPPVRVLPDHSPAA
ncbi:hypothetical protein [Kitasatospora fiedleri]|uniref:hypothetical protein n=1 Tax=Kitasatospora fiedleri TaxID=2991545 RepID=UPI00249AFF5A|nr:hypothetical protein [Kitasatospora fiedleri]